MIKNNYDKYSETKDRGINYIGSYPALKVFFDVFILDGLHNETVVELMKRFCKQFSNGEYWQEQLFSLHHELTDILAQTAEKQFEIFNSFKCMGLYLDHKHEATMLFISLLHFTEKEMTKRGIKLPG